MQFNEWYSLQMAKQLEGKDSASFEFEPIKLGLPTMKELGAR